MRVIVYVEGASDVSAMESLLRDIVEQKLEEGVAIKFVQTPAGDRKASLLTKAPVKAVNILMNESDAIVAVVPDLYPKNKAFPHETVEELNAGIRRKFNHAVRLKRIDDPRLAQRFHVFCFKHDLEALILASEQALRSHLRVASITRTWTDLVEDQNHGQPPKRVVENLFRHHGQTYEETADAPAILGQSDYNEVADKCPQCFKPFVEFLMSCSPVAAD